VRHSHVRFQRSRRQAERELACLVAEHEAKPTPVVDEPRVWGPLTTLNGAIAAWRDNRWDDLSPKTVRHYESIWRVHIEPAIGRQRVVSLTAYDVERFYRSLKAQGLSQATVRRVKAVLHGACRLAQKWSGGTLHNPASGADLPIWRLEERRDAVRAPEIGEVQAQIAAAEKDSLRLGAFMRLLAATGMRWLSSPTGIFSAPRSAVRPT
jgi:integrase